MNLREICRLEGYPTTVLTTFTFDPLFFERVVLRDLLAGGTQNLIVLADASQCLPAIGACQEQLHHLGRKYRLFPVDMRGAFHPKLCLRLSPRGAVVACGSGNLTRSGWLGIRRADSLGGNREAATAWTIKGEDPGAGQIGTVLQALRSADLGAVGRGCLDEVIGEYPWTTGTQPETAADTSQLILTGPGHTLAQVLAERWRERRFDRIQYATGSTDDRGAMLAWASTTFGVRQAVVAIDPELCGFRHEQLDKLAVDLRVVPLAPRPRSHMKFALFEGPDGAAVAFGSANCSAAAWLVPVPGGGNVEATVVLDECDAEPFIDLCAVKDVRANLPITGE